MRTGRLIEKYLETFGSATDGDLERAICGRWHKSPSGVRAARKDLVRLGLVESARRVKRTEYGGWSEVWRLPEKEIY